jgi:acyl-CoA thioesterase-2
MSGRYPARAWWGDRLLAETQSALAVSGSLWFPRADVRLDEFLPGAALHDAVLGDGESWDLEGDPSGADETWFTTGSDPASGGKGAVRAFPSSPGVAELVTFDHERVRVEVIDAVPGEDPRLLSVKRWPVWGDAADLVRILSVAPVGEDRYVGAALADPRRPVAEASQMLGQAIVAAGRHAPGRRAVSAHMVFHRPADARLPVTIEIEEVSGGRSFTTLAVHAVQDGRRRASGTLLLDVTAPDVVRHAAPPPTAPGPLESPSWDMSVTGRDVRFADDAYADDSNSPAGPPVVDAWVRFRSVGDDPLVHAGLLAQFTGHVSIAAALRSHEGVGQDQAHRTLSMGLNAISLSLHAEVRADQWMRYHHHSTFAGDGMTHSECRVYTEDGALLASFAVDAMVRGFAAGRSGDSRAAL